MLITKEIEIDMGHRVTNHKSKCASLHGHRYKIEVGVNDKVITTKGTSDEGMVIDFGDLKQIMMEYLDAKFDHGYVLWEGDNMVDAFRKDLHTKLTIVDFIPTAENLAKYWYNGLKKRLDEVHISIAHIIVWETPTSTATYTKEDYDNDNK
jgi:6-pyruvoyltetrahydropterin/6-carboxytetrahydropterin synthase